MRHGEHRGVNRGFGIVHILAEHTSDLRRNQLPYNETGVIQFVELILKNGAQIFSEFSGTRGVHRPMIICSRVGTVILEPQQIAGEMVYSVITAFGGTTPRGTQIGMIRKTIKAPNDN